MAEQSMRPAAVLLAPALALALATSGAARQQNGDGTPPRVLDDRLQISLFASEPDIVTPIGIAIDAQDRIYVLESHTHLQASDYKGPAGDRVKVFTDADRDGTPDRMSVFAEGINDGMNLAFSPEGVLYVVAAKGVWALHDRDGDGVSEARTRVLNMTRPAKVYDHAALLGLTFSPDGWLHVSRGNTGSSPWRVEGTDGSFVGGYGDGGNIFRSRPAGTSVQEVATGFWNPFDLRFDSRGRLLAADNDPDSRGPNRLVHVVQGGDYGYKSLYGGSGIHPYVAWNGELPGTLPYAAPLGEAPSGVLVGSSAALPADYRDDVLVTIWEERRIVRVPLRPKGVSVAGEPRAIVEGDERFRPVAFATDSRGTVYITDWVLREYANHGRGRLWRLTTREGVETVRPRPMLAAPEDDPAGEPLRRIYGASGPEDFARLRAALLSDDPFVRSAAVTVLSRPEYRDQVVAATEAREAQVRLGALLALHRGGHRNAEPIARRLLTDSDLLVRRMALIWIGSAGIAALEPDLEAAILTTPPSPELFEVYLATLQQLSPEFRRAYAAEAEPYASQLKRLLRPRFVESFVSDEARPPALRAIAIAHLENLPTLVPLLVHLAGAGGPTGVRREAVRSLGQVQDARAAEALLAIARSEREPHALRADALLALGAQPGSAADDAIALLDDPAPDVRLEAARYLRSAELSTAARVAVAHKAAGLSGADAAAVNAQLVLAIGSSPPGTRPSTIEEWLAAIGSGTGSADRGRRVFFSSQSACSSCHRAERRGGDLDPDLTNVGRSKTRAQIVEAILRPSAEISPEYQGWFIRTKTGELHTGRQIDVGDRGRAELYVLSGQFITVEGIAEYGPMPQSLMPDGLESTLTIEDMRDLVAYLEAGAR
jgi:putative membrane-bound dehydrogenase-like protein